MTHLSSMRVPQFFSNGISRGFGQRDCALLNNGRQFACRTDEVANLYPALLAIDNLDGEQRAAVDLVVEPQVNNTVEEDLRADRRIKHFISPFSQYLAFSKTGEAA